MKIGGGRSKHIPATSQIYQSTSCTLACEQGLESLSGDPHKYKAQCRRSWCHVAAEKAAMTLSFPKTHCWLKWQI